MKQLIAICAGAALSALVALPASAACYADYKAKRGQPLELHYGVIELPDRACVSLDAAAPVIARRIAVDGWTLLAVVRIFDESGLTKKRRERAGPYFLRY
ncbi:MAG: hypothetical protein D6801_00705 [Alphaproteobacteria bacterium]|nr:MAG: hypothetical protein D6801_00705 [Alphaproteobacteria bacterium]